MSRRDTSVIPNALLQSARKQRGWTASDLVGAMSHVAILIGETPPRVDPNAISRWERGVVKPCRYHLRLLCLAYGVFPEDLGFSAAPKFSASVEESRACLEAAEAKRRRDEEALTRREGVKCRHVWNHKVHEKWCREHLYYLWLTPSYDPVGAPGKLVQIMERLGVRSFIIYELFGPADLLARVWLPDGVDVDQIEDRCREAFGDQTDFRMEAVDRTVRHWVWGTEEPPEPELRPVPSPSELALIRRIDEGTASPDEVTPFQDAHLVVAVAPSRGLRFILEVKLVESLSLAQRSQALGSLVNALSKSPRILEKSLYRLGASAYLISGRVDYLDIFIISELTREIVNGMAQNGVQGVRTSTYICSRKKFVVFREALSVDGHLPEDADDSRRQEALRGLVVIPTAGEPVDQLDA